MVSKNQIKLIKSLSYKKFRNKHHLFVVEGIKGIEEFLDSSFELVNLFALENIFSNIDEKKIQVNEDELKKISFLKTSQRAVALFKIPQQVQVSQGNLTLALDGVRDPGNLGTIIRLCDWFGVESILCSKDTVDCFNPKVVQASMGSLTRVKVMYCDLKEYILKNPQKPVYGAMLSGSNVYSEKLEAPGILIMGNEANGISSEIEDLITQRLSIPQYNEQHTTESLNVATATAILLSEFRRNFFIEK